MILEGFLRFFFFLVVFSVFAYVLLYYVFKKGDGNWSVISTPLRYIILPVYSFISVYFGILVFEWLYFVPNVLVLFINIVLGILFDNIGSIIFIWQILCDLIIAPVLYLTVCMPVIFIEFKHDKKYNFNYRRIVLLAITLLLLYTFTIETIDGIEWYENVLFCIIIILAAIITHMMIIEDYSYRIKEKGFMEKLRYAYRFILSLKNRLKKN